MRKYFVISLLLISPLLSPGCRDDGHLNKGNNETYYFPDGFVWGASGSAYQTEGGNYNNDWYQWEQISPLLMEAPAGDAVNAYNLYDTDAQLVKDINLNTYRFSVEWSRIEPERDLWDDGEIEHYRKVIRSLTKRNIRPMLTFHHFTNPVWVLNMDRKNHPVDDLGGWLNPEVAIEFAEYAGKLAAEFGSEVDWYLTINEPIVIALLGYLLGANPPGEMVLTEEQVYENVIPVMKNLITAHALAYDAIRENDGWDADDDGRPCVTGLPESIIYWEPANPDDTGDVEATGRIERFYSHNLYDSLTSYGFDEDLDGIPDDIRDTWQGRADFIGFNYYNHWYVLDTPPFLPEPVSALPCISFKGLELSNMLGCPEITGDKSDMGYEIFPEGIYNVMKRLYSRYNLPILITENGIATTDGEKRARFIVDHLGWVRKAIEEGVNVTGYIYWSLTDNWEWGTFEPRFGLYSVDYEHEFKRILTRGGEVLGEIASCNCLSKEILEKY